MSRGRALISRSTRKVRAASIAGAAWLLLATSACSWIKASPGDYADYRQTRVGETEERRLTAASRYLSDRPDGAYAEEVARLLKKREPAYFAAQEKSPAGLARYVAMLPNGPHAREARSRLRAIREQEAGPDPLLVAAAATRVRLEKAAARRDAAQAALHDWIARLVDPSVYAAPLSEARGDLVVAFSLSLPTPLCKSASFDGEEVRVCAKEQHLLYDIPVDRKLTERELGFTVEIAMNGAGVPTRASIAGEELLSRLAETYAKSAISAEKVRDRIDAVERGVDFVAGVFESSVSADPSCRKDVVAPTVLALECKGTRVELRAGDADGALDEITITPAPVK